MKESDVLYFWVNEFFWNKMNQFVSIIQENNWVDSLYLVLMVGGFEQLRLIVQLEYVYMINLL